jgi:hypothetical protein
VIRAQDSVSELEQRVSPQRQAVVQPGPEIPQPLKRPPAGDRVCEHRLIRNHAGRLQDSVRTWQGDNHGRFLS